MKGWRTGIWLLTAISLLGGCGVAPQSAPPLGSNGSQAVDAQSVQGLHAALKLYLTSVFKCLDVNGDGALTYDEASTFFSQTEFDNLCKEGQTTLSLSDLLNNQTFISRACANLHQEAIATFEKLDTNQDGRLTWDEYAASLPTDGTLTAQDKSYAQVAFDLADKSHSGYLTLSEYEDLVSMADAQQVSLAPSLTSAFQQATSYVTGKYGNALLPMGLSVNWIDDHGQFTRSTGAYVFTYWNPVAGQANAYYAVTARYSPSSGMASVQDSSSEQMMTGTPSGLNANSLVTPIQAIASAEAAGLPSGKTYCLNFQAGSHGFHPLVTVTAYQNQNGQDVQVGVRTLDAETGQSTSSSTLM